MALCGMAGSAFAQGPQPLPDFKVTTPDGAATNSSSLVGDRRGAVSTSVDDGSPARPHQWLLVYVAPNCPSCEKILNVFHEKTISPLVANNVVVIVGDLKTGNLKMLSQRFPWVPAGSWFLDTLKEAFQKLDLKSNAVILGVRDLSIQWKLVGPLSPANARKGQDGGSPHNADLKQLTAIVSSWITEK